MRRWKDVERVVVNLAPWLEPRPICWAIDPSGHCSANGRTLARSRSGRPKSYAGVSRSSDRTWPGRRSVLVYVVAVLEVPVPVVDMVDVVTVLNGLTPVVVGVRRAVIGVDLRLSVPLAVVDMVDVVAMRDGLVAVTRQVLVVARFDVFRRCHGSSKVGLVSG